MIILLQTDALRIRKIMVPIFVLHFGYILVDFNVAP